MNCSILISKNEARCKECSVYRKTLNSLSWQYKNKGQVASKYTTNVNLTKDQLRDKATNLYKEVRSLRRSLTSKEQFISSLVLQEGHTVPETLHDICQKTITQNECSFEKDSVQSIFWEQQKKQASLSKKST